MGYAEYPHLDLRPETFPELIRVFEQIRDNYAGTLKEISDLRDRLDRYENDVTARIDARIETAITTYKGIVETAIDNKFSEINAQLSQWKNEIDDTLDEQDDYIRSRWLETVETINSMDEEMKAAVKIMQERITENNEYMETRMTNFENEVESRLREIGLNLPLQVRSIQWIWRNILCMNGMTAYEWYHYPQLTCEEWNKSEITCLEWYCNSRRLLYWDKHREKLFSPITGDFTSLQEIVIELINRLNVNAITAGEFDKQEWTAQEIDEVRMLAGRYDWLGDIIYKRSAVEHKKGGDKHVHRNSNE